MDRRKFTAITGFALAVPQALFAQPAKRVFRIAILDDASEKARPHNWAAFRARLSALGIVEGKNAVFEARFADGQNDRIPRLAYEMVSTQPDIVICASTPATRAAMRATTTIPIVFAGTGDPVGTGLVTSLSRPGSNVTGLSVTAPDIALKNLELLRELVPGLTKAAYLTDAQNTGSMVTFSRMEERARQLKISVQMLDGSDRPALERSLAMLRRDRVQGLIVAVVGTLLDHREQIIQFASQEKLPAVYGRREYVDAGGLLSYGIDRAVLFRRAAELAHRILQGTKPADIPVEQIAAILTVLNMKTARALGIKIPDSIRIRADEVIE